MQQDSGFCMPGTRRHKMVIRATGRKQRFGKDILGYDCKLVLLKNPSHVPRTCE